MAPSAETPRTTVSTQGGIPEARKKDVRLRDRIQLPDTESCIGEVYTTLCAHPHRIISTVLLMATTQIVSCTQLEQCIVSHCVVYSGTIMNTGSTSVVPTRGKAMQPS